MNKLYQNAALPFLIGASSLAGGTTAQTCIQPTGLHLLSNRLKNNLHSLLAGPGPERYLWFPMADTMITATIAPETPIQFRIGHAHGSTVYNAVARYHETALDIWGRDEGRICRDVLSDDDFELHLALTAAYAFYKSGSTLNPTVEAELRAGLESNGLDASLLDGAEEPGTPWGIANIVTREFAGEMESDGWNADGSLTADYNALPFSDFSVEGENGVLYEPYVTQPPPRDSSLNSIKSWPWEPLVDSDGRGYFCKQEFVTPQIGFTGRLYGMTRDHYDLFQSPSPNYNYRTEVYTVLDRTKSMATDNLKKVKVEFYNVKWTSLLPIQIQYSLKTGASEFQFWFDDMVAVNTMYDATLLIWKEKVIHNLVRPTTAIHRLLGDTIVNSYAGPYEGAKSIKAKEWQASIRVMPHAEYPSGSACVCTAFVDTMKLLNDNYPDSDIIVDKQGNPVTIDNEFRKGSSKTEPGLVPSEDILLQYTKWSEIVSDCGESRLYGGMHFKAAVDEGNRLCKDFINPVVENAFSLLNGNPEGRLAVWGDHEITVSPKY